MMADVSGFEEGLMLGQPRTEEKGLRVAVAVGPVVVGITKPPDAIDMTQLAPAQM